MKRLYLFSLIVLSSLFTGYSNNAANAKQPTKVNQQISIQDIQVKKDIESNLGSIGRAQQAYFLQQNQFTRKIKDLGLGDDFDTNLQNYQLQIITDRNAKQSVMVVLTPKKNGKTYISLVQVAQIAGESTTIHGLCESTANQIVIPQLPQAKPQTDQVICPSGFQELKITVVEEDIYNQAEKEQELKYLTAIFNILQQRYYRQNQLFADSTQMLFSFSLNLDLEKYFPKEKLALKFIPPKDKKQGIAISFSIPNKPYNSYMGIVRNVDNNPEAIICKSQNNQNITSAELTNISINKINCPQNFQIVKLSSEEISKVNSEVEEVITEIQKSQNIVTEINQPTKNPTLVEAERLAAAGQTLAALQKYQQYLSEIGLQDFLVILMEKDLGSGLDPFTITVMEAFLNKVNPLLAKLEPTINQDYQDIQQEMSRFISKYQRQENEAAIKIRKISALELGLELGLDIPSKPNQQALIPSPKSQEVTQIGHLTREFFQQVETKPGKINEKLPSKISQYLAKKQSAIAKIRNTILSGEIPTWGSDISWIQRGDTSEALPSFIGNINLHDLLLADAIIQYQKGQRQPMLESLEAAWKISESLQQEPILISQLVSLISYRRQIQVMRQMDNLPSAWQQKLASLDVNKTMINALIGESLFHFSSVNRDENFEQPRVNSTKLFRRWDSISFHRIAQDIYSLVNQQKNNACNVDTVELANQFFAQKGYKDVNSYPMFLKQVEKAYHLRLEAEMTQKVLQIKENKNKLLNSNLNSSVCPGSKWVYQNLADGKWSISLDKPPIWNSKFPERPLTYVAQSPQN